MPAAFWALALTLSLGGPAQSPPRAQTWPDDQPITHLFQNFGKDLSNLASGPNGEIVTVGVLGAAVAHTADHPVSNWAMRLGETPLATPGNIVGNGWTEAGAAIGTYAVGELTHHKAVAHIGSDLIRAQFLNAVFTEGLKLSFDRTRPTGSPYSFPSGHTSASFASAGVLAGHFGWRVSLPAFAIAGYVGFCRIRDDQHWLSDVAAGAAVGLLSGHTVTTGHRARTVRIAPAATRGGASVWLIWTPNAR